MIMSTKRLKELISKKKSGEISLSEQRELLSLVKSSITNETIYNATEDFFDTALGFEHIVGPKEVEKAVARLNNKIGLHPKQTPKKPIPAWITIAAVAASLILFIGIAFLFSGKGTSEYNNTKNIVATKKGSKSSITLPDGSRVWINNDTKITYNKNFGNETREVTLIGEAYFDVIKDVRRPFIVHTKTLDIKVLGTAFNVRAYSDEKNTETTLLRGSVEILLTNKKEKRITLKPNEKIVVQNTPALFDTIQKEEQPLPNILLSSIEHNSSNSSITETQWMENKLAFDGDKIEDVAVILERWYNIKVVIKDSSLSDKKVNGVFEDRSLNNVMEALSLAVGFKYTIDRNSNVIISAN